MSRMSGNNEASFEIARNQFRVVDANGLITEDRPNIDPDALPFARTVKELGPQGLKSGSSLAEVDRANEIYKVEDQKFVRGRNQDAILAACLYIACRQEDIPCGEGYATLA